MGKKRVAKKESEEVLKEREALEEKVSQMKQATPFAAARVAETVVEKVKKAGLEDVAVLVKGIGSGRDSAIRALANHGLNIMMIKDITPVPHNGPRPKKVRRV